MHRREFIKTGALGLASAGLWGCGPAAARPTRVVFFTDVHAMDEAAVENFLANCSEAIRRLRPDVILGGGDYLHGGFSATEAAMSGRLRLCQRFLESLGQRTELMMGNHDLVEAAPADGSPAAADPRSFFRRSFGIEKTWRSFRVGDWQGFLLDSIQISTTEPPYIGWIDAEQIDWLKRELAGIPDSRPILLMSHIPFRTTFFQAKGSPHTAPSPRLIVGNANEVLELFQGKNLRVVLQGHLHVNEHINWNGTHFIMGGAVCGQWWKGANLGTSKGFGLLELGNDIRWTYISM